MPYIYNADIWSDQCGRAIIKDLLSEGKTPDQDSDVWPQPVHCDEADSPRNCACGSCSANGEYGEFMENSLTSDGYEYLAEMLNEHGENLPPYAQEWADYYGFSYDQNTGKWSLN